MSLTLQPHSDHYCYVLALVGDDRLTYIGYTVNVERRLRQHNGELAGGARFTTRHGPACGRRWRVVALVTSTDLDHHRGLSLEWHIRNPPGSRRRRRGRTRGSRGSDPAHGQNRRCAEGRVLGMAKAMSLAKFSDHVFTAWIVPEFRAVLLQAMGDAAVADERCDVHAWPWSNAQRPCPEEAEDQIAEMQINDDSASEVEMETDQ